MSRARRIFYDAIVFDLILPAIGFAVRPDRSTPAADSPRLVCGRGVPTATLPASSVYLRLDGGGSLNTLAYVSNGSTWTALSLSAAISAIAALTPAADKVPYFTSASAGALATLTSQGRTFLAAATQAAQRAVLGLDTGDSPTFTAVSTDTVSEKTANAGVTIDGVLLKDGVNRGTLYSGNKFLSAEQTGTGSSQNIAHGLSAAPALVFVIPSDITGGAFTVAYGAHDATNAVVTVTSGEKYRVVAFK
jgi:hypothetical protein